ncbi:hypothetical protein C8R44DRAFT_789897, partial [Mycena epipterygia]
MILAGSNFWWLSSGLNFHSPESSELANFYRVFEVAHVICIGKTLYQVTISDFENPQRLLLVPTALAISLVFSSVIGACVQGFFSFRIYRLSKNLYIPTFIWTMAFLRVIFSFLAGIYGSHRNLLITAFDEQRAWILYIIWVASTINDLTIAATLVYWLYRQRINAQMKTLALMDKLIKWTIETGVITSTASTLILIFFVIKKDNDIWVAVYTIMSRLYSNSLLASLNSRATLRVMNEITLPHSAPATVNMAPADNIEMSKISYAV